MSNGDLPRPGVILSLILRRIKFETPLNCDPESWFYIELWPQVLISLLNLTPSEDSKLNRDLYLWSQFNVKFWPRVVIQRGIWPGVIVSPWIETPGHNSLLKCDPGFCFNIALWPRFLIPRWIMTPGLNSTLNCDPESWYKVKSWSRIGITIVEFSPRFIIQLGVMNQGHNLTWNVDMGDRNSTWYSD